jgi:hypothetical protein
MKSEALENGFGPKSNNFAGDKDGKSESRDAKERPDRARKGRGLQLTISTVIKGKPSMLTAESSSPERESDLS